MSAIMAFIPNTTPTPNWLYNGEMKKMNETELKVVLLVTRKTLGWFDPMTFERKTQDNISQSQFIEFTGKSNRSVATAIQSCVQCGWIIARDKNGNLCNTAEKRTRRKVWYQLGSIFTDKISGEQYSLDNESGEHFSESGEHNDTNLVNNVHSTKVTSTKVTSTNTQNKIYSTYKQKIHQNSILTDKAKKKIQTRLKTFTESQLLQAIDNFSKDKWWMKHNSHRGIAWFFHSDDRIEGFINLKAKTNIKEIYG